jgi:hypothetical protein
MVSKSFPLWKEGCIHKGSKENIMNIIGIDISKNKLDCALINDSNHAKFKFKGVKFLLLAWAGVPKTSFRKNSDSPHLRQNPQNGSVH